MSLLLSHYTPFFLVGGLILGKAQCLLSKGASLHPFIYSSFKFVQGTMTGMGWCDCVTNYVRQPGQ